MLILFVMPKLTAFSQNRNVVWVHGLGGDGTAWQHYATIFENERKIVSTRPTYTTTSGLSPAATQLMNSWTNTTSTNIGIGHSMGGVVIREVDRITNSNEKRFGGFITIASPNYGAPISANVLNGNANSVIATAMDKLGAGPLSEFFIQIGLPWTIISGWTTTQVTNLILNNVAFMSSATNNSLKEGSTPMTTLNNFNSTAYKISIIAEETTPVHWRMAGSMFYGANSGNTPGDEKMVQVANEIRGVYNSRYNSHKAYDKELNWILDPVGTALHVFLANEWKKGRDWMDQSETIWKSLIKATQSVTTYEWKWVAKKKDCGKPYLPPKLPHQGDEDPLLPPKGTLCWEWEWKLVPVTVTTHHKSDGLLPVYVQELKGASGSNRYVIDHANHMELKNMSYSKKPNGQAYDGTRNTLNAIFNRSDWFKTDKKNN